MDSFLRKHKKDVFKLCDLIADEIATRFELDKTEIVLHLNNVFKKPAMVRCTGFTKDNIQCAFTALDNEQYCRRHLWCKETAQQSTPQESNRCMGINRNNTQCMVRATVDNKFCKKHMYQDHTHDTLASAHKCVHYELDEDAQEEFVCDRLVMPGSWCCQQHASMNKIYKQHFKAACPQSYLEAVEAGTRNPNPILTSRFT